MQHFDRFIELDKLIKKNLIIYKPNYQIEGAYIHNESEFRLLSNYFAIGKTYAGQIEIANNYFRGEPDWYFLEGEDGGRDYPATYLKFKTALMITENIKKNFLRRPKSEILIKDC